MLDFRSVALLAAVTLLGSACGEPEAPQTEAPKMTWEEFRASAVQDPEGKWIFDGDQAVDSEEELRAFFISAVSGTATSRGGLAVYNTQGQPNPNPSFDVKWSAAQKGNLTYCVSNTFGANKAAMVAAMNQATGAWEGVARVNFIHNAALDANCTATQTGVLFDVRPVNSGRQYLARAFFPNAVRSGRNLLVDNVAFGNIGPWTLAGLMRHELGHILGFIHEYDRCSASEVYWRELTVYDYSSVMQYPGGQTQCSSRGSGDLTPLDMEGARALYP